MIHGDAIILQVPFLGFSLPIVLSVGVVTIYSSQHLHPMKIGLPDRTFFKNRDHDISQRIP